jgi:hypothetical protein
MIRRVVNSILSYILSYSEFTKCQEQQKFEKFRKQRNFVTKLKRKSMKTYFLERCSGGTKSGDFWKTIKPFLSKRGPVENKNVCLMNLTSFQKQICLCSHFVSLFLLSLDDQKGRKQYLILYSQLQWRKNY